MSELFGDLFYPLAPAALTWWIFQDPWISGIWCAVRIGVRFDKRRRRESAYNHDRREGR
jgi:hypothetical protein